MVVAATEMEIAPCRMMVEGCDFVVTGIGATNTALAVVRAVEHYRPRLVVQIGIGGAVDKKLDMARVYYVCSDYQADLGAWRDGAFVPFVQTVVENPTPAPEPFIGVRARSVMTACTERLTADRHVQMESMEGAAFFQTMQEFEGIDYVQLRSVSNYLDTPRHLWQTLKAVSALPKALREVIVAMVKTEEE